MDDWSELVCCLLIGLLSTQRRDAENQSGRKPMTQFFSTTASKISLAVAFTALVFVLSPSVKGDEFDRIDRMAQKIQKKSRLLIKETVHYRHTRQYASLIDATQHLYDAASHVHEVAHFANNLNHLQADLADLEQYFHQLEGLFQATEDSASRGRGHVEGNAGYRRGLLRSIEVSIDLMRRDVRKAQSKIVSKLPEVYRAPVATTRHRYHDSHVGHGYNSSHGHGPAVVQSRGVKPVVAHSAIPHYRPVYPQQRRSSGFSLSIGGGSSRLNFNF